MDEPLHNRELSWLLFNGRVLQEASDPTVPLLQRLRFLGIFSNNQDEFLKVRVAGLERQARRGHTPKRSGDGCTPATLLARVNARLDEQQHRFEQTFAALRREMEQAGIVILDEGHLRPEQRAYCREYFARAVSSRLVPVMLRRTMPSPLLPDNEIYLAVRIVEAKSIRYAAIGIPTGESSPRFVVLPPTERGIVEVIFLDDVIRLALADIFFMFPYREIEAYTFKLMRDAQFMLGNDALKSLAEKMEQGLEERHHGRAIRLIYDRNMPADLLDMLRSKFGLRRNEALAPGGRYHRMADLMRFPNVRPDLEESVAPPVPHPAIRPFRSILHIVRRQDVLLHFPYHPFQHVVDLLREAAVDPKVVSIRITLYRTAEHSKVLGALVGAARNGKRVVAHVELKARFDEEHNISTTELLQREGIRVIHSPETLKVHAKLIHIDRREGARGLRGYAFVGTGNFNESTAAIYSDLGLLTTDRRIVEETARLFDALETGYRIPPFNHLLVSPTQMRHRFRQRIEAEIRNARRGEDARIVVKCNSLTDEGLIRHLYRAAAAGVEVQCIVRGACSLCPSATEVGRPIRAVSIVDQYLEHARIFIFHNGGEPRYLLGSADWMTRNLDRRIEVVAPVYDRRLQRMLDQVIRLQLADNVKARDLTADDNRYVPRPSDEEAHRSQTELYAAYRSLSHAGHDAD